MRFDEAAAGLTGLPSRLPPAPAALMPVRVGESAARPWAGSPRDGRPAAVLVLVVPDADGEARIVLTERTTGGRHHSGEISFPGGRAEPEDADLVATALREAAEEIGLRPTDEVARIIEAPLDAFLGGAPIEIVERTIDEWTIRYGAYAVEGLLVWGATARILGQLGALLAAQSNLETGGNPADITGV